MDIVDEIEGEFDEPKDDGLIIKGKKGKETVMLETSAERLLSAKNLKNVFKEMFTGAIVVDTFVKRGSKSSANIYVNRKHEGKKATVIIWEPETN